jgi:hypothetical protein
MRTIQSGVPVLAAAGLALSLVWLFLPTAAPPLYDGLVLPPEPYRYLHPTGRQVQANLPPTAARKTVTLGGAASTVTVATRESPPQAEIVFQGSAFHTGPRARRVTISIRAVSPPPLPPATALNGNLYAISATADGHPAVVRQGHVVVVLRATSPFIYPVMEEYASGHWQRLHASPGYHADSWGAQPPALGMFGLMVKGKAVPSAPTTPWEPLLAVSVLVVGIVAVALFLLRRLRSRAAGSTTASN